MELLSSIVGDISAPKKSGERDFDKRRTYGGVSRRTHEPVRRSSRLAGREGLFWGRTTRKDVRRVVLAARKYELHTKAFGARTGALGTVAIEILDLLANLVDFKTGRLDPSLDTLMQQLRRSRDAIVRGLKALRTHGFLDWLRRYVPTGNEGSGPQVQQTSNAYRLSVPARARRLLGRYGQDAPAPDDFTHTRQQHVAAIEEHRASLPLAEFPLFDMEADNPVAQALSRLGKAVEERESAKQTESLSKYIS